MDVSWGEVMDEVKPQRGLKDKTREATEDLYTAINLLFIGPNG